MEGWFIWNVYRNQESMTSQAVTGSQDVAVLEFREFIRGYHSCQRTWNLNVGDVLHLEQEPTNCKNKYGVAVVSGSAVNGHLP